MLTARVRFRGYVLCGVYVARIVAADRGVHGDRTAVKVSSDTDSYVDSLVM